MHREYTNVLLLSVLLILCDVMVLLLSLFIVCLTSFILWKLSRRKKGSFKPLAQFDSVWPCDNGLLPSSLDAQREETKTGDILYFFGFDSSNSFHLTLKKKTDGCFFLVKINLDGFHFENCGFLEEENDGSFR